VVGRGDMRPKTSSKPRSTITEESERVHPSLLGMPLASFRRRLTGFMTDLIVVFLLTIPAVFATAYVSTRIAAPRVLELVREIRATESPERQEVLWHEFTVETAKLIYKRMPERMSEEFQSAFAQADSVKIDSLASAYDWNFTIAFSDKPITRFSFQEKTVQVGMYVFLGRISIIANIGVLLILYFTAFTWLLRGFTPGKWLLRIRVLRLDDKRLTVWDSFGRAAGYSASIATLGLGFLEALWDPNRQAMHDRISRTVVVRLRKK
jgi:hypothetical protein